MKRLLSAILSLALVLGGMPPAAHASVNAQTGTTYTFVNTDCDPSAKTIVTFNNASSVAVTLPQAGASNSFLTGCVITAQNIGLGTVTITPTTSTINGAASLALPPGSSATIGSDASPVTASGNYWAQVGGGGSAGASYANFRNLLDNGSMIVAQRGTSATACGGTTGTTTNAGYSADRWACIVNVGSQAGYSQVVTSSPTPPSGFRNTLNVYRNTGALTQPVCTFQEVPYNDAVAVAGQPVTFSFYAAALAGLSADNGGVINAYIMTGTTSTDQGLATMTASPAITPAWTGIAATTTKSYTIGTSFARYSLSGTVPSTTTSLAVAICFTPTASGSGATDGFSFTGAQLEQGLTATQYEFRPYYVELPKVEAYYWQLTEPAAGYAVANSSGVLSSTTNCAIQIQNPVVMRAVPAVKFAGTALSTSTWRIQDSTTSTLASTYLVQGNGNTANGISLGATLTTSSTAGWACQLQGAGGGSILQVYADF